MAGLLGEAKAGKAKLFLQFGGQGAPWYKELSKYYSEPAFGRFFDAALNAIDEERSRVEGSVGLPYGLDARAWLDDESKIPSEEYLGCAAVSIPMIQMTQLAHLENLLNSGLKLSELVSYSLGASGHSQGLIPAGLVALNKSGDDYYEAVARFMKYLLYLGVSAQKAFPHFAPAPEETARSEKLGAGAPSPMVAVLGEDHGFIENLVKETNQSLPADQQIYISLYNTPANRILSSFRASLVTFHEKHAAVLQEKGIKFVYLRTTCPFHSAHMEPIREIFEPEIKHVGFDYSGNDLTIPVYSFFDGTDLKQTGAGMPQRMYVDMAINTLYWDRSMKVVAQNKSITHVLDFGPGKTSQRLSTDTLKGLNCETPVLAAAVPKDLKTIQG
ncbi:MAG: ACP S-malonyltransferase [Spirochaetales bacterium]|nr:ACP S-malonyltransferase [Leptospiraceae bacterium]MCP5482919.1 ACP S-malonyltransferase [Spirochaetales bacterium]MCP5484901.1 ACP S-malonyltransferase [Spirochaetales bacterium]